MDQIVRVIAKDAPVKAIAISARDTVERARALISMGKDDLQALLDGAVNK